MIVAGAGSAGPLERTVQALLQQMGRVPDDVRALFHVYIALVSGQQLHSHDWTDCCATIYSKHMLVHPDSNISCVTHADAGWLR